MRKALVLGVLGLAGTLASPAFADDFTGFRLGMNLSSDTLASDLFFEPALEQQHINESRFGYGLFGGWALNRYFGAEVGLRGGSEFNSSPFDYLLPSPNNFIVSHTDIKGIDATVIGTVWIGKKFGIFGRAGGFFWKAEQTMSVGNYAIAGDPNAVPPVLPVPKSKASVSVDDNGFAPLLGIGIQTVLDGALIRLEYQQTEIDDLGVAGAFNLHDSTVNSLNFSIVWTL